MNGVAQVMCMNETEDLMIEHKQKGQITKKDNPGKRIWLIGVIAVMVVIAVIVGSLWVS